MRSTKFLNAEELKKILSRLDASPAAEAIALSFLIRTGLRGEELMLVTKQGIDLKRNTVEIRAAKGSNDRTLPIKAITLNRFHNLLDSHGVETFSEIWGTTFETVKINLRRYLKKTLFYTLGAGYGHISLHALRASYAIIIYETTKDIMLVKELLGHKSISSTMFYMNIHRIQNNKAKILKAVG